MTFLNKFNSVLFALSLISLVGCGKNPESDPIDGEFSKDPITLPVNQKSLVLKCAQNSGCPEGLFKIVTQSAVGKVNTCLGVLVAKDRVLMNLSCLPRELRVEGVSCQGRVLGAFNRTVSQKGGEISCDKVERIGRLSGASDSVQTKNFAMLKMKISGQVKPIRIDYSGPVDGESAKVWYLQAIDNSSDNSNVLESNLVESSCEVTHNSFLNPSAKSKRSRSVVFTNCERYLTGANSNVLSAVGLDSRFRLLSLVHSTPSKAMLSQIKNRFTIPGGGAATFSYSLFGLNVSCLDFEFLAPNRPRAKACEPYVSQASLNLMRSQYVRRNMDREQLCKILGEGTNDYQQLHNKVRFGTRMQFSDPNWQNRSNFLYLYCSDLDLRTQKLPETFKLKVDPVPSCFEDFDRWVDEYRTLTRVIFGRRYYKWESPVKLDFTSLKTVEVSVTLNSKFRLEVSRSTTDTLVDHLTLSPKDLHKDDESDVEINYLDGTKLEYRKLPLCP
jgi:hypothetical protein